MGPVRQNQSRELLVLFVVCSSVCTIAAHNTAQNRPDNFPSCPPDNLHDSNLMVSFLCVEQQHREHCSLSTAEIQLFLPNQWLQQLHFKYLQDHQLLCQLRADL